MVISDASVRAAGVLDLALAAWGAHAPPIYTNELPSLNERVVQGAALVYRSNYCDGLIAVGGGSCMDPATGVTIAATHSGPLKAFPTIEGDSLSISKATAPVIAVPTTAGTGSEVARGAILVVADGRKLGFHSAELMPRAALCDPELTLSLPPDLTAATGMDAIAHCMETFMSAAVNPPADGIALDGLRRGWNHLERACRNGLDREARWQMRNCSRQARRAALQCQRAQHAGGMAPASYGRGHGSGPLRPSGPHPGRGRTDPQSKTGLAGRPAELGVDPSMFERAVTGAMADHCHRSNP